MNGRPCGASIHFRWKLLIPPDVHAAGRDFIGIVRAGREFCRRLFIFGAGLHVSGIARLRGSRACSADGQQDFRCAVRWGVERVRLVDRSGSRLKPHRVRRALCALDLAGGGSFPFEQHRFCAPAKTLDASCAHQAGVPRKTRGHKTSVAISIRAQCAPGATWARCLILVVGDIVAD